MNTHSEPFFSSGLFQLVRDLKNGMPRGVSMILSEAVVGFRCRAAAPDHGYGVVLGRAGGCFRPPGGFVASFVFFPRYFP
jgi:hypothetical protein